MTDHATPRQRGIIDQMRDLGEEPTFTHARRRQAAGMAAELAAGHDPC